MAHSGTIPFDPAKLRSRRLNAGLRQSDLAEKAGLSQGYISDIEGGRFSPTVVPLKRIADVLGCEPTDLLVAS